MAEHYQPRPSEGQPILICGASGTLGRAFAAECRHRDLAYILTSRATLELGNPASIARALDHYAPLGVVNAAGWVRVDEAEGDPKACHAANATGAIELAGACAERGIPTLCFSSDLVFNGRGGAPYREGDPTDPLSVYGRSKAAMETGITELAGEHLIVRTAAFFSPFDEHNFAVQCLRTVAANEPFRAAADCTVSPTYVPDLCRAALDLLIDRATGIWHLTNAEAVSWYAFAGRLAGAAGLDQDKVIAAAADTMGWAAARPACVPLESRRGSPLPTLDHAIARFARVYAAQ